MTTETKFENDDDLTPDLKEVPLPKIQPIADPDCPMPTEDQIRILAFRLWEAETDSQPTTKQTEVELWLEAESLLRAGWAEGKAI